MVQKYEDVTFHEPQIKKYCKKI